jgi:hypothetical protein
LAPVPTISVGRPQRRWRRARIHAVDQASRQPTSRQAARASWIAIRSASVAAGFVSWTRPAIAIVATAVAPMIEATRSSRAIWACGS